MSLQHALSEKIAPFFNDIVADERIVNAAKDFLKRISNNKIKSKSLYYVERKQLPCELRKAFQRYAIDKQLEAIPTQPEIQEFMFSLETSPTIEIVNEVQKMITYQNFVEILSNASAKVQEMIPAALLFGEFISYLDELGRLNTAVILQFLSLKCNILQYRATLALNDEDCSGYVNREQMLDFLEHEVFSAIDSIKELDDSFRKYYVKTVMSMFFFFLDHKNFGRLRIADVVVSGFLENTFVLQNNFGDEENRGLYENWFSPEKTQELYSTFQMLDENAKGHLSKEDFSRIGDGAYTPAFIGRLFEVHVAKKGREMSYDEFIVFQIAQEHLAHPAAIKYFFKVLDLNEDGFLTLFELSYFYKDLKLAYCNFAADSDAMPEFNDFADSLFDMAQPSSTQKLSFEDLVKCKQGHEFILILINHVEFSRFENKESENGEEDNDLDSIMPSADDVDCEDFVENGGEKAGEGMSSRESEILESIAEEVESHTKHCSNSGGVDENVFDGDQSGDNIEAVTFTKASIALGVHSPGLSPRNG